MAQFDKGQGTCIKAQIKVKLELVTILCKIAIT